VQFRLALGKIPKTTPLSTHHDAMAYKVAGKAGSSLHRHRNSRLTCPDISLAAFGRKEIEIAEVRTSFLRRATI
jgi:hypothetical protein